MRVEWYVLIQGEQKGPYEESKLHAMLQAGEIPPDAQVWKKGLDDWIPVGTLLEDPVLARPAPPPLSAPRPLSPPPLPPPVPPASPGRKRWGELWRELFPFPTEWSSAITNNPLFWIFLLVGCGPLLISALTEIHAQLLLLSVFYAMVWGGILKVSVLKEKNMWGTCISAMFFTGLIGVLLLFVVYAVQEEIWGAFTAMTGSVFPVFSLIGYLFLAFSEELVKILPAFIFFRLTRTSFRFSQVLLIGMFSGLGFAATENILYSLGWVEQGVGLAEISGGRDLQEMLPVFLVGQMLRSTSLCFLHATWTGIATAYAFGAGVAVFDVRRFFLGVALSTLLHTFYNWTYGIFPIFSFAFASVTTGFFLVYFSRYRFTFIEVNPPTVGTL